ncbi:MAG: hypothetical protein MJ093_09380 [Saccharofermentans sp.]|nr:hypothetical protein [Saccharofermentans sp.]
MNEIRLFWNESKKIINKKDILNICLLYVLLSQFFICCYFNLACIKNHIGFDASWSCLKTALIWNDKTLISPLWAEQNNLFFDSSTLLAVPFYAITKNIFLSFGIVNIIVLLLILWAMGSIISMLELNMTSKLVALNLVISPYMIDGYKIINDIRYFNNVISGASHSAFRSFIALMIVYEFIRIKKQHKFAISTYITFALCILSGAGIGVFLLILMLIPYIAYEIEITLIKNDLSILKTKDSIFGVVCSICIIFGKFLITIFSSTTVSDNEKTWTTIEEIWKNFGAVFQGFLGLLNVLPLTADNKISIMSYEGILRLFPITIFTVIVIAVIFAIKRVRKNYDESNGNILFILNIVIINFISFGLFKVQYGAYFFEERYLITTFFATIILVAYLLSSLDKKKLYTSLICIAMTISIAGNNIFSDINYYVSENYVASYANEIIDYINEQNDSELIYVWGNDHIYLETTLRIYDLDHYYKLVLDKGGYYHFGDYKYYDNNADYSGPTYLVIQSGYDKVPNNILSQYTLVKTVDQYQIYRCDRNPINY